MWRHPYDDMAKMAPVGGDGYGLYGDDDGLYLGPGVPLIAREVDADGIARFAVRPQAELDVLLHAAYGMEVDLSRRMSILKVVANSFEKGEWSRAMISAAHLRLPPLEGDAAVDCLRKVESLIKYNFNPNEPRDWHGRWTYAGGGEARPAKEDTGLLVASADPVQATQLMAQVALAQQEPVRPSVTDARQPLHNAPSEQSDAPLLNQDGNKILNYLGDPILVPEKFPPYYFAIIGIEYGRPTLDDQFPILTKYLALLNFRHNRKWDVQRVNGKFIEKYRDYASVAIGIYGAASGIPIDIILEFQNLYAKLYSKFKKGEEMDKKYKYLPRRNVGTIRLTYRAPGCSMSS